MTFDGLKIVIDCANGAGYKVGPDVLEELGADVSAIGVDPDGININDGCGAVYPERLCAEVLRLGADVGIALDGDSDRVMIADERGEIFDGDDVMAVLGIRMASDGRLNGNAVVGTVMRTSGLNGRWRNTESS